MKLFYRNWLIGSVLLSPFFLFSDFVRGEIFPLEESIPIPLNFKKVDFAVPWGLRNGQPSRNFFEIEIGQAGEVKNIITLKTTPHGKYARVALDALKKFKYPPSAAGQKIIEEIDYCVLSDGQSTFPCRIKFIRLGVSEEDLAKTPSDPAFYKFDKFSGFPKVLKARLPEFPLQARRRHACGWVKVAFIVDHKGRARSIKVLDKVKRGLFVLSTVEALKNFKFEKGPGETKVQYLVTYGIPGHCRANPPIS